ncbi:MAG: hypothetical protein UR60_C0010G0005 [Candidatus Moranbacteria bacterium GW2011_GWF2_34_56]|nr:MAG: hypothetical protein UR60_C0010G0005 [Candidatus Moranbacteria bacterium GW2011_GWF2_34_56]
MTTTITEKKNKEQDTKKTELINKKISTFNHEEEEQVASRLAKELNLSYVDLNIFPLDIEVLRNISEEDSVNFKVGIIKKIGKKAQIVTSDPTNEETLRFLKSLETDKGWEINIYVISQSSMDNLWRKYRENILIETLDFFLISLSGKDLDEFEEKFKELLSLKERMSEMNTTEILKTVFSGAIKMGASDVHFEPQKTSIRMRYRIDGVLQSIGNFFPPAYKSILSRIKMVGKMKLNLKDIAQDGHFTINIDKENESERVDIRVSIIPGKYGESIVLRLLSQSSIAVDVESLGLKGLSSEQVSIQLSKPNGMVLITGPTGSGKTTTLYSFLKKLNTPNVKIITIEDPIEYEIKGISQTQVPMD